jgi:hypothetical protein
MLLCVCVCVFTNSIMLHDEYVSHMYLLKRGTMALPVCKLLTNIEIKSPFCVCVCVCVRERERDLVRAFRLEAPTTILLMEWLAT